jgi:hypothetical protein
VCVMSDTVLLFRHDPEHNDTSLLLDLSKLLGAQCATGHRHHDDKSVGCRRTLVIHNSLVIARLGCSRRLVGLLQCLGMPEEMHRAHRDNIKDILSACHPVPQDRHPGEHNYKTEVLVYSLLALIRGFLHPASPFKLA